MYRYTTPTLPITIEDLDFMDEQLSEQPFIQCITNGKSETVRLLKG